MLAAARLLRGSRATAPLAVSISRALAAFGRGDAVAQMFGMRFTGWFAWWLWRTVYLLKMPGWGRKLRIAADWTLDLFSGRDFVELGVHRTIRRAQRQCETSAAESVVEGESLPPRSPPARQPVGRT